MLDDYSRECPRCHSHLAGEGVRCPSCHKLLPRKLSKVRRVVENSAIGVVMAAIAVALLAPDFARALFGKKPAVAAPVAAVRPWKGAGPEPVARAWALPIEESLQGVCRSTISHYDDKKYVVASLQQFLPAATRDLRQELTQESLRLSPDEEKDALGILTDDTRFMGECLRIAYDAIKPCAAFKSNLSSPAASECMVPSVARALAPAPFRLCSQNAKLPRVRRACELAADNALKLVLKEQQQK
jgi:hypothetical protein